MLIIAVTLNKFVLFGNIQSSKHLPSFAYSSQHQSNVFLFLFLAVNILRRLNCDNVKLEFVSFPPSAHLVATLSK